MQVFQMRFHRIFIISHQRCNRNKLFPCIQRPFPIKNQNSLKTFQTQSRVISAEIYVRQFRESQVHGQSDWLQIFMNLRRLELPHSHESVELIEKLEINFSRSRTKIIFKSMAKRCVAVLSLLTTFFYLITCFKFPAPSRHILLQKTPVH